MRRLEELIGRLWVKLVKMIPLDTNLLDHICLGNEKDRAHISVKKEARSASGTESRLPGPACQATNAQSRFVSGRRRFGLAGQHAGT